MVAEAIIRKLVVNKTVNITIRTLLKSFPVIKVKGMPIVGKVCIELPKGQHLCLDNPDGSDIIANRLFWLGLQGYEYETVKLFIGLLKTAKVFLDIGAYTGYYALIAAIANKNCKVYAFEPVPKNFNYLNRNVIINNLSEMIMTSNAAVTNYDGEILLYIPEGGSAVSASTLKDFRKAKEIIKVPAVRLDPFVTRNKIPRVDLIKMDVEGTEHRVLEGAKNVIKRDKPIIICEVLKDLTENFLHSFLDNFGYKYYWISDKGLIQKEKIEGDATYKFMNYLFIEESKINIIPSELQDISFKPSWVK